MYVCMVLGCGGGCIAGSTVGFIIGAGIVVTVIIVPIIITKRKRKVIAFTIATYVISYITIIFGASLTLAFGWYKHHIH